MPRSKMLVTLPAVPSISNAILRNPIRQIAGRSLEVRGDFLRFNRGRPDGYLLKPTDGASDILVVEASKYLQETDSRIVLATIEGVPSESLDLSGGNGFGIHTSQGRIPS